jgi:ankyrin repeat protein
VNKCNTLTGGAPLHITCTSPKALDGRLLCAQLLLDAGADPLLEDSRGMTPVAYAAEEPAMAALLAPFAAARSLALAAQAATFMGGEGDDGSDDDDGMPELEGGAQAKELLELE